MTLAQIAARPRPTYLPTYPPTYLPGGYGAHPYPPGTPFPDGRTCTSPPGVPQRNSADRQDQPPTQNAQHAQHGRLRGLPRESVQSFQRGLCRHFQGPARGSRGALRWGGPGHSGQLSGWLMLDLQKVVLLSIDTIDSWVPCESCEAIPWLHTSSLCILHIGSVRGAVYLSPRHRMGSPSCSTKDPWTASSMSWLRSTHSSSGDE